MRRRLTTALVATALTLAAAAPGLAGPIDASAVPDQSRWVVHVDLEAFRASTLGRAILGELGDHPEANRMRQASEVVGFDLERDLLDVTLYGSDFTRESVVMLVDIAGDAGNLEGLMLAAPGYESATVDDRVIHSFLAEDKRRGDAPRMHVTLQPRGGEQRLVASYDADVLHRALDRMETGGNTTPLATAPEAGSLLFMHTGDLDPAQLEAAGQQSAVLQMIRRLSIDLVEADGRLTATAHARVVDDQKAEQLRQLAQGMLAMAQLGDPNNPGKVAAAELARRAKVTKDGATVRVSLDAAAEEVAARVRELANR